MVTYTKEELEKKLKARRNHNVKYHGIGRTLGMIAGSTKLINVIHLVDASRLVGEGQWLRAQRAFLRAFTAPTIKDRLEGAAIMATSVGIGKALDKAQINPHVELILGQGLKLW